MTNTSMLLFGARGVGPRNVVLAILMNPVSTAVLMMVVTVTWIIAAARRYEARRRCRVAVFDHWQSADLVSDHQPRRIGPGSPSQIKRD